jgi:YhcN/YlaJ family sporulation lipoprotein
MRYFVLFVLVLSTIVGCNNAPSKNASPAAEDNRKGDVRVQQTVPKKQEIDDAQEVANRLARLASAVPQVNDAKVVVIGNTAIVGLNVDANLERSRVDVIKYSVSEALRKDPHGAHAFVTADMDLTERIKEIREDMNRGRPVAGFAEELADIIGRIVPQIPKDITPLENPPAETEDRKQLNQKSI